MILLLASAVYIKPFDRLVHRFENNRPVRSFTEIPPPLPAPDFSPGPPKPKGNPKFSMPFDFVSVFLLVMLILIVISKESVKRWRITEQRAIHAEAEKAQAELSFLKAQINPHFLFNTLNNIYPGSNKR
jgi:two-component system, LytTR family, sensor kinase